MKEPVDGFLGLGRDAPFDTGSLKDSGFRRGPSFMKEMKNQGHIDQQIFSLEFGPSDDEKFLHLGTPQTGVNNRMKDPKALIYISLQDDLFWATNCQGFAFGALSNNYRFPNLNTQYVQNHQIYSIFDSGSAQIVLPQFFFNPYVKKLFSETGGNQY